MLKGSVAASVLCCETMFARLSCGTASLTDDKPISKERSIGPLCFLGVLDGCQSDPASAHKPPLKSDKRVEHRLQQHALNNTSECFRVRHTHLWLFMLVWVCVSVHIYVLWEYLPCHYKLTHKIAFEDSREICCRSDQYEPNVAAAGSAEKWNKANQLWRLRGSIHNLIEAKQLMT